MDNILRDLRFGARNLWKRPGATVVALITLALGIGVNTAIFSAVDSMLLRPLPFNDPDDWFRFGSKARHSASTKTKSRRPTSSICAIRASRLKASAHMVHRISISPATRSLSDSRESSSLRMFFPSWVFSRLSAGHLCPTKIKSGKSTWWC